MKITKSGSEYSLKTPRFHYLEYVGGVLFPKSVSFKGTFTGDSVIQGLRFEDWLGMMIHNKILIPSEIKLTEQQEESLRSISPLADPFLVVEDTDQQYIAQIIFTIVNSLLETGSNLTSLICKQ